MINQKRFLSKQKRKAQAPAPVATALPSSELWKGHYVQVRNQDFARGGALNQK